MGQVGAGMTPLLASPVWYCLVGTNIATPGPILGSQFSWPHTELMS